MKARDNKTPDWRTVDEINASYESALAARAVKEVGDLFHGRKGVRPLDQEGLDE